MLLHLGATPHYVVSSMEMAHEALKTNDAVYSDRPMMRLFYGGKDVAFARFGDYWRQEMSGGNGVSRIDNDIGAESAQPTLHDIVDMLKGPTSYDSKIAMMARNFKGMKPPTFAGSSEPADVESWINEIKRTLRLLRTPEDLMVELASYQLQGGALTWWSAIMDADEIFSWGDFERLFLAKYFLESIRDRLQNEFFQLTQGDKTVMQYEEKFNRLVKYAIDAMTSEKAKAKKFIAGLRISIRRNFTLSSVSTFAEAVDKALQVEQDLTEVLKTQQRNRVAVQGSQPLKRQRTDTMSTYQKPMHRAPVQDPKSGLCFGCGQPGHIRQHCPKAATSGLHPLPPQTVQYQQQRQNNQENQRQGQQAQGKVFAIGYADVDASTPNDGDLISPADDLAVDPTLEEDTET